MFYNFTDEQFYIWLAGFFDGEGNVYIPKWGVALTVACTDRDLIMAIYERTLLGQVQEVVYTKENWKTKYAWRVRTLKEAGILLERIRPYLTIKAKPADLALVKIREAEERHAALVERNQRILDMAKSHTHQQVADAIGVSRPLVSLIVKAGIADTPFFEYRGPGQRRQRPAFKTSRSNYKKERVDVHSKACNIT